MSYFTWQQKIKLARSVLTKKSPIYVQYYITARCNLACEQCNIIYADGAYDEMNIDQIRAMAENMAEIGVTIVLLIGGEPFVRKDIHEIVKAFVDVGIHVRLQTNGLATRAALEKCVHAGAHDISISLDSLVPNVQETINGGFQRSWHRAIDTVATINEIFPETGSAFFGTVIMPQNFLDIPSVLAFATEIGWGMSLVPVHASTKDQPRGFRTFDPLNIMAFDEIEFPRIKGMLGNLRQMREQGFYLYDSDEYMDDMYRFMTKEPIKWRDRNAGVCDSPHLYFAVAPNGTLKTCCDYEATKPFFLFDPEFPNQYLQNEVAEAVYPVTRDCDGCMYGSYPEVSITARYLGPLMERFTYFNFKRPVLKKLSSSELKELAANIFEERKDKNEQIAKVGRYVG